MRKGVKYIIEINVNNQLNRFMNKNTKSIMKKWEIFGVDMVVPTEMSKTICTNELYIECMRNHINELLDAAKTEIANDKLIVEKSIESKIKNSEKNINAKKMYAERGKGVFKRIEKLPDELIRYIADYAFTPYIRLKLVELRCPNIKDKLMNMKSPNINKMVPAIENVLFTMLNYINKMKNIPCYKPFMPVSNEPIYETMLDIKHFYIAKNQTKLEKIRRVTELFDNCNSIIKYFSHFTLILYKNLQKRLHKLYHTIIYVSEHRCNKRK